MKTGQLIRQYKFLKNVSEFKDVLDEPPLREGDKVRLNVPQITARKDYTHKQAEYREFVEQNGSVIFTVRYYRKKQGSFPALVEFQEDPKWLFWVGDLIRVEDEVRSD